MQCTNEGGFNNSLTRDYLFEAKIIFSVCCSRHYHLLSCIYVQVLKLMFDLNPDCLLKLMPELLISC